MYRFRSINNLLGEFNELEKQEIYFASPEELNDPMEGFKDIFWSGDEIVWKNFITNYARSIEHSFSYLAIVGDKEKMGYANILVEPHRKRNTSLQDSLMKEIIEKAFENKLINELPMSLSKRRSHIRRDELLCYLHSIHPFIINVISDVYYNKKMTPKRYLYQDIGELLNVLTKDGDIVDMVNKMEEENSEFKTSQFFAAINSTTTQVRLISRYNYLNQNSSPNSFFLSAEFTEIYLSKLEASIYPDWYSASFLSNCNNSALWGYYGDNHKGVCLKYRTKTENNEVNIDLDVVYGSSSDPNGNYELRGMKPQQFRKIKYHNKHVEIDFFRSLARTNRFLLNHFWYSDENGNLSICGNHLDKEKNEEDWRNNYWKNFLDSLSVKALQWQVEDEYRLVIHGDFNDYSPKETRKLKYAFNDLEAVIFGIKTSASDKVRIIKIIENKCKKNNRKEFDFYQAYYSKDSGKIETVKLTLIKFD